LNNEKERRNDNNSKCDQINYQTEMLMNLYLLYFELLASFDVVNCRNIFTVVYGVNKAVIMCIIYVNKYVQVRYVKKILFVVFIQQFF